MGVLQKGKRMPSGEDLLRGMAGTFRLGFVGKGGGLRASVVMGYPWNHAVGSGLAFFRLQELAVLNDPIRLRIISINLEGGNSRRVSPFDEYINLQGQGYFVTTAGSEYVSMGGRDSEMTFGIGKLIMLNYMMQITR
ncbi:MAG: hypothetical protein CM15mP85_04750 [Rhodobacterales bacterium]|nr:MAG: hypothetical protein CM15mP85_04750 [Rhodobacterales bacterium]